MSNITEELSQEIATSGDEGDKAAARKQSVPLVTASMRKDSIDSYEVSEKQSERQNVTVGKMSTISKESVKTSRDVDKNLLETQKSKSTFKPIDIDKPSNETSKKNLLTPKSSRQA